MLKEFNIYDYLCMFSCNMTSVERLMILGGGGGIYFGILGELQYSKKKVVNFPIP